MHHSINVRAFAASEPHRQCATPFPECKHRSADARSGRLFAARASFWALICRQGTSTNHSAGPAFPPMACMPMLFLGARGSPAAPVPIQSTAMPPMAGVPLLSQSMPYPSAYTWLLQLGPCICLVTCLGPRWSSPPHSLNVSYWLCNVRNWRLES